MTGSRTLCVVHNNANGASSIGKLARWAIQTGLDAGYRVSVVARDLDPKLKPHVEHLRLYVPPRIHALQWAIARPTVRQAIGSRKFDIMHVYQPQIAAMADTWHVQFLSRSARTAASPPSNGHERLDAAQAELVARMEDAYLRRLPDRVRLLFCSAGLRDMYNGIYGLHPNSGVLHNPALDVAKVEPATPGARKELTREHSGPVVGFLGGGDPRKGGQALIHAVAQEAGLFLLAAGPECDRLDARSLGSRYQALGRLASLEDFFASIDALVVPSRFEPFGMVVAEAAARGVPSLVAPEVGAFPLLAASGAGAAWSPGQSLTRQVEEWLKTPAEVQDACLRLTESLDPELLAKKLVSVWEGGSPDQDVRKPS